MSRLPLETIRTIFFYKSPRGQIEEDSHKPVNGGVLASCAKFIALTRCPKAIERRSPVIPV